MKENNKENKDIDLESPEDSVATENPEGTPEDLSTSSQTENEAPHLQGLLEDARAKADEHWEQLLRAQAEMENLRKRLERDVENAHKYALERFALELLPVKDSLEMGLQAAKDNADNAGQLIEGVELTLKMLTSAMEKHGITEVSPDGEPFNPDYHQAMTMQEDAENPANTVLAVMQKGYLLQDRLIRPAMVVVSKPPATGE
jgi:molecular chaperone GrpE